MTNILINSRLGATFSTDPAVGVWTFIKNNWSVNTGYNPPAVGTVKFDTKFGAFKGFSNYIIVENMPVSVTPQTVGGSRFVYGDIKRLQILCIGPSAKNNKWKIERHIDSIVNGNITGMQATYGIDTVMISEFTELNLPSDDDIAGLMPSRDDQRARSFATVTLRWEQETVSI